MLIRIIAALFLIAGGVALLATIASFVVGKQALLELVFGPVKRSAVDFATLQLGPKPNQYLVCPPGFCQSEPHREAPTYAVSAERLEQAWFEMIERQPRVTRLGSTESAQYDFEATTALMGYPDTVTVRFIESDEGSSMLAIYSRSHYGHSDLGANKKRIDSWLEMTAQALP